MKEFIGRVVTRLQGDEDGLIIGCSLDNKSFKPNYVYSIEKCLVTGEITLKPVGESVIGGGKSGLSWAFEQQLLLRRLGNNFFLTEDEYLSHYKDE